MTVTSSGVEGGTPTLLKKVHRLAPPLALAAAAIGALAIAGWALGIDDLRQIGSLPELRSVAAVALLVTGCSLAALATGEPGRRTRIITSILLGGVAVSSVALVLGQLLGVDLDGGLDTPRSAHGFIVVIVLTLWILTMDSRDPRIQLASRMAAVGAVLGVISMVIGYAYDVSYLSNPDSQGSVSPQGVIALILLTLAAAAARPDTGIAAPLVTDDTAGRTLRQMLPVAFGVPLVCGFLFVQGAREEVFGVSEGVTLVVVLGVLLFGLAVVSTTRQLARTEVERDRLQNRLEELADRDPLTDLYNRRRLVEEYERQVARVGRGGGGVALAILDLDNLKPINDRLGHAVGDRVIVAAAKILREGVRITDAVARIGGDEFAVLLADVDEEEARAIVGELLRSISTPMVNYDRNVAGDVVYATASAGIAVGGRPEVTLDQLMHRADKALYEAKSAGGSEVRIASLNGDRPPAGAARN
jgi:diguanylate cyclase (GGDEF)-like protein